MDSIFNTANETSSSLENGSESALEAGSLFTVQKLVPLLVFLVVAYLGFHGAIVFCAMEFCLKTPRASRANRGEGDNVPVEREEGISEEVFNTIFLLWSFETVWNLQ